MVSADQQRSRVIERLAEWGEPAAVLAPGVVQCLRSPDLPHRKSAVAICANLETELACIKGEVIDVARHRDAGHGFREAIEALMLVSPEDPPLVKEVFESDDVSLRGGLVAAINALPQAWQVRRFKEELIRVVKSEGEASTRSLSAAGLRRIAAGDDEIIAVLRQCLERDYDRLVRMECLDVIVSRGDPAVVIDACREALGDGDSTLRYYAAEALSRLAREDTRARTALERVAATGKEPGATIAKLKLAQSK